MKKIQRIKAVDLKEGMRFSAPVFFEDGENMFLAESFPVKAMHINALIQWNIPFVITYGSLIDNELPLLQDASDLEELEEITYYDEPVDNQLSNIDKISDNLDISDKELINKFNFCLADSENIFTNIKTNNIKNLRNQVDDLSEKIYALINDNWQEILSYIINYNNFSYSLSKNAVICSFLCALITKELGYSQRKITQIIISSILHDIGMLEIPENIINKSSKLTKEEYDLLKLHTIRSAQYSQNQLYYPKEISNIIIQHHEQYDGNGYPNKLASDSIDIFARILSICDSFTSMIEQKAYKDSINGNNAMKNLLDSTQKQFDPYILNTFIKLLGIYPIGSKVILTNKAIAQVVDTNPLLPFLPDVKILVQNNQDTSYKVGDIIKLSENNKVGIIRSITKEEYCATA